MNAYEQFFYTNSEEQIKFLNYITSQYSKNNPMMKGYLSALKNPLFDGKKVNYFDIIIQGHVHFKIYELQIFIQ